MGTGNLMLGVTLQWTSIPSRGSRILLVASWYVNRDKFQRLGHLARSKTLLFIPIGATAAGVPGEVKGLYEAWKKYGKLHWVDLVQPSIDMARNGFPFSPSAHYAATLSRYTPILKADPGHR